MNTSASREDELIFALAGEMQDGDRVFIGVNQPEVTLAAHLARALWAPNLRLWFSCSPRIDRSLDSTAIGRRMYDRTLIEARSSYFWQARVFDDLGPRSPVVFAGGLQVDAFGNANLEGVRDGSSWKLRGPGSAGLPTLTAWAPRFYIVVPRHRPEALVRQCDQISALGDPTARESWGMQPDALAGVLTPLATFAPSREGLVLTEVSSSVSEQELGSATGFDIVGTFDRTPRRPALDAKTAETLADLRRRFAANRESAR